MHKMRENKDKMIKDLAEQQKTRFKKNKPTLNIYKVDMDETKSR